MLTIPKSIYVIMLLFQLASGRSHSSRKRQIPNIGSPILPYDEHISQSFMHEQYYTELKTRYLVIEKMVELEDPAKYSYVV